MMEVDIDYLNDLLLKNKDEAISKLVADGISYRIVSEDNTYMAITCDYDPNRVNLDIHKGVIENADLG